MKNSLIIFYITFLVLAAQCSQGENHTMPSPTSPPDSLSLFHLMREPQIKTEKKKALVLLHGLGSNEKDLFELAARLPGDYYIFSPRGIFTLSEGSYAWYHVDFSTGKPVYDLEEEKQSREAILTFLQQIKEKYAMDEIILGGFSQGAIMSCTIGLLYPEKLAGVVCLSGRILQEIRSDVKNTSALQHLNIFLAHGTEDGTLPIAYARESKTYLEQLQTVLSYHEFRMGHQVNEDVLKELNAWLVVG